MSRKIYVTSDMGLDSDVYAAAEEDPALAMLWPWLLPMLDDWGRGCADSRELKARMFPDWPGVSGQTVENALQLFAKHGLLNLYIVDGKRYMAVSEEAWRRIQTHIRFDRKGKTQSKVPAPTPIWGSETVPSPLPGTSGNIPALPGDDRQNPPSPSPSPSPTPPISPPKCAGSSGQTALTAIPGYKPRDDDVTWLQELSADFPDVDVALAIRACRDHWTGKQTTKKANWRSRVRNWVANDAKWAKERAAVNGGAPADPNLVRPDMVTMLRAMMEDGARPEDLRAMCVSDAEFAAVIGNCRETKQAVGT